MNQDSRPRLFLWKVILVVALWLVVAWVPVFGQMSGTITGQVSDQTGAALSQVMVTIRNVATESERTTITDGAGRYQFGGLSIGIYSLSVKKLGFSDASRNVSLAEPGEEIEVNFELTPGSIAEVVTVTASRGERDVLDIPVRADVTTEEMLQRENPTTTGDALLKLPSLTPVNSGPYLVRPRLRGLDSTRLVLMVDGERLNTSRVATDRAGPEIGLVDPSQVKSIEVVHGAGSALYGTDALSGTINIVTDMPEPVDDKLRIGGSFNGFVSSNEPGRRGTAKVDVSGRKFAVRASFMLERYPNYHAGKPFNETSVPVTLPITVFSDTEEKNPALFKPPPGRTIQNLFFGVVPDPFNQPFTRTESEIPDSQSHGSNASLTARFFPTEGQSLRLKLTRRRTALTGFPDFELPFFFQVINLPFSDLDKVSLHYEATGLTSWLTRVSLGGYWQDQDRLLRNDITVMGVSASDIPNLDDLTRVDILSQTRQDVKTFGFNGNVGLLLGVKNILTVGMDYFRDHSRDSRLTVVDVTRIGTAVRTTGAFFPLNAPIVTGAVAQPQRIPISNFQDVAFFVEDEFDVLRWLRLFGSFRVDRIDVDTRPTPNFVPRIPQTEPAIDPSTIPPASGIRLNRYARTGNFGIVIRPNQMVSITARVGRSFRHPNLEELFFFGPATIGGIIPNIKVKPETGVNVDVGVKLRTSRVTGELTYFNNTFMNFISTEITGVITDKNDPDFNTGDSISQAGNFLSRLRIQGLEASWDVPFTLHDSFFTWFGNLSYLKGTILRGAAVLRTEAGIGVVNVSGKPADNITPFKSVLGMRWNDRANRFWWEYSVRSQTHVNRVSPFLLDSPFLIPQDLFGLFGFSVHSLHGGYNFHHERYTVGVTLGLENLGNKFYREQFQFSPARGRSFTLGLNFKFF